MSNNILEDARLFLFNSLKGAGNDFETRHPWRKGWEFAVLHSQRVESYAAEILERESHTLSGHEVVLLRLAAILHDIGSLEQRENHAELGAEIVKAWFQDHPNASLTGGDTEKVLEMIADHSKKDVLEQDYCKAVLKDADTLDEIGVMSIFMAGNWVERQSPFFFHDLRRRLIEVEIPFCDQKLAILNTDGAKQILREKKAFVEVFIAQLSNELQGR